MIGQIFKLRVPCLSNEVGTIGVVYDEYEDFDGSSTSGKSIIFENGEYDGFSAREQQDFLELVNYDVDASGYEFKNVMQLSRDFNQGYWDEIFQKYKKR